MVGPRWWGGGFGGEGAGDMRLLLRFFGFLFALGTLLLLVGAAGATYFVWKYSQDLPDYTQLQNYEPPVMTRVHAGDGSLVAEYARQRRLYIPIQSVPKLVWKPSSPPRTRISMSTAASIRRAFSAPPWCSCRTSGRTAATRRLHHHPAGGQELPAHE